MWRVKRVHHTATHTHAHTHSSGPSLHFSVFTVNLARTFSPFIAQGKSLHYGLRLSGFC